MDFCEDAFIRPTKGARLIYYYYYYFGLCGSIPQFSDPAFDLLQMEYDSRFSFPDLFGLMLKLTTPRYLANYLFSTPSTIPTNH